jgi:hypothetical protein
MSAGVVSRFALRSVKLPDNSRFAPVGLPLGNRPSALEGVVARVPTRATGPWPGWRSRPTTFAGLPWTTPSPSGKLECKVTWPAP